MSGGLKGRRRRLPHPFRVHDQRTRRPSPGVSPRAGFLRPVGPPENLPGTGVRNPIDRRSRSASSCIAHALRRCEFTPRTPPSHGGTGNGLFPISIPPSRRGGSGGLREQASSVCHPTVRRSNPDRHDLSDPPGADRGTAGDHDQVGRKSVVYGVRGQNDRGNDTFGALTEFDLPLTREIVWGAHPSRQVPENHGLTTATTSPPDNPRPAALIVNCSGRLAAALLRVTSITVWVVAL